MTKIVALACIATTSVVVSGCSADSPAQSGSDQPYRVRTAQFLEGELPGEHPMDGGTIAADGGTTSGPPKVRFGSAGALAFTAGQGNLPFGGWTSKGALSVGLGIDGLGKGYWVVPVGTPDPGADNDPAWSARLDFDEDVPVGEYTLRMVAIDERGDAGLQHLENICVGSKVFDNLHGCFPKSAKHLLPRAVISLTWDTNVDLDLQVRVPGGRFVDAKNPVTVDTDGGALPSDAGRIDRDSNLACVVDGIRTENLVWQDEKPSGTFEIYANLYDSCKQPAVRFLASVYIAVEGEDGKEALKLLGSKAGELLDFQANGGTARGLFVTAVALK